MPLNIDESREMDPASRRTFGKLKRYLPQSGSDAQRLALNTSALPVPTRFFDTGLKRDWLWDGTGWIIMLEPPQAWASSPVISQVSARTSTTTVATMSRSGGWCQGTVQVTCTQAGTAGNLISVSAPVSGLYSNQECGSFLYLLAAGTEYSGTLDLETSSFFMWSTGGSTAIGVSPSFATANGDRIFFNFNFEMTSRYS